MQQPHSNIPQLDTISVFGLKLKYNFMFSAIWRKWLVVSKWTDVFNVRSEVKGEET